MRIFILDQFLKSDLHWSALIGIGTGIDLTCPRISLPSKTFKNNTCFEAMRCAVCAVEEVLLTDIDFLDFPSCRPLIQLYGLCTALPWLQMPSRLCMRRLRMPIAWARRPHHRPWLDYPTPRPAWKRHSGINTFWKCVRVYIFTINKRYLRSRFI